MASKQQQMIGTGKKLAQLNPAVGTDEYRTLLNAREWFRLGGFSRYSNEDFDVHQAMLSAIYRLENKDVAVKS